MSTDVQELERQITGADRLVTWGTWGIAAGAVFYSLLTGTPFVRAHTPKGWEDSAWALPLVVDIAFVIALHADSVVSRLGVTAGYWPLLLRVATGAGSLYLNTWASVEKSDWVGVATHMIAPVLLVLAAEAGPAWRRAMARKLADAVAADQAAQDAQRARKRQEDEDARRKRQEDEDREKAAQRAEEDRQRAQRLEDERRAREQRQEDEQRALALEEKREAGRAARQLEVRRLDLEEKRLTATIPAPYSGTDGMTAARQNGTTVHRPYGMTAQSAMAPAPATPAPAAPVRVPVAPVAPAPHTGVRAQQARTEADRGPAVAPQTDPRATAADSQPSARKDATTSVAATQTTPARVTARVETEHQEQPPAGPVKDWDLPGLPAEVRPGIDPVMLTDEQSRARIRYGLSQEWTQRRIGEFAGRSATTVNKVKAAMESNA
ncbi:hypothetical protein [Streptomyces sp. NPDC088135]|uniref:hypothetical protein n=1 Tax=Streptomyces sp. NPDC088135 TaxID=3160993 RepID=UPI00343B6FEA